MHKSNCFKYPNFYYETAIFQSGRYECCIVLFFLCMLAFSKAQSQKNGSADILSLNQYSDLPDSLVQKYHLKFLKNPDGREISEAFNLGDTVVEAHFKNRLSILHPEKNGKRLRINGGYVNITWNDTYGHDSSFILQNASQYILTASVGITISEKLPLRITLFDRESNSPYYKSYRNVRIDIDMQKLNELRYEQLKKQYEQYAARQKKLCIPDGIDRLNERLQSYDVWLKNPAIITRLVKSREIVLNREFADTSLLSKDSLLSDAKNFITFYEQVQYREKNLKHASDSLADLYNRIEAGLQKIRQSFNNTGPSNLQDIAMQYGLATEDLNNLNTPKGLRQISVGNTIPDFTPLTLQNINVNGLNYEYNSNHLYLACAAGVIDYRVQDFLERPHQQAATLQYLYSGRVDILLMFTPLSTR